MVELPANEPPKFSDPNPDVHVAKTGGAITQAEMLEAVADFASASIELIAWEFSLELDAIQALWDDALDRGLLVAGDHDELGELPCTVTPAGAAMLEAERDGEAA